MRQKKTKAEGKSLSNKTNNLKQNKPNKTNKKKLHNSFCFLYKNYNFPLSKKKRKKIDFWISNKKKTICLNFELI